MPSPLTRIHLVVLFLLLLLVAALYVSGLNGPFIFDDGPALTANPHLRIDGAEFDDWRTASLSSNAGPLHRPLAMLSFAANYVASGGVKALPVKSVNLFIHLGCGVLVFALARLVLVRGLPQAPRDALNWTALLAAALWLLAPLHVSTVLYAVQRMTGLATLFALAALLLFAQRRERWARRGAGAGEIVGTGLWIALLTTFSVLSKENGALVLWLIPVMEVSLFRGEWAGRRNSGLAWLGWGGLLAPLVLLALVLWFWPEALTKGYARRDFSLHERLLTQLRLLWQYLAWMVFPDIGRMGFQHDDIPLSQGWLAPVSTLLAGVAWCVLAGLALVLRTRVPLLLFAVLFYLVGHFLESSIWPLEMVYEHRNYLPSVAVFILCAALLAGLIRRLPAVAPAIPVCALVAVCGTLLFLRVFTWAEPLRLSAVNAANHPASSRSHYFLAQAQLRAHGRGLKSEASREELEGHLLLARHHFELMYQENPRDMAAIVMLFYLDEYYFPKLQQYNDWFGHLRELSRDRPLQASDYAALGALVDCFAAGACDGATADFQEILDILDRRYPGNVQLGVLRYRYMRLSGASSDARLAQLQTLLARHPGQTRIHALLLSEQAERQDLSGMFETVKSWMYHDPGRRELGVLRRVFSAPSVESEASDKPDGSGNLAG
ncbi:hypothetical protein E4634_07885 [Mangrovimicrobium sediminis]|uniref:Tetratricopeptide repeat protein n=1 Tax=Mangrovimicrobium sediminis TaxID=2562682 RepID=A0A4Z0M3N3_9GAMM|nr:hypothetical protein [Haliea sp. SAOS-164]TGD74050.1 hypothetical protein E4634_07885 [Haliea sp. SAOS-164]